MLSDDNDVATEFLDMTALKYGMYCKDAMSGLCGKTTKFWMIYCHLVIYTFCFMVKRKVVMLIFSLMCCMTCQIILHSKSTKNVKWMTRYSVELLNLNLPLRKMLMNEGLSAQPSKSHFSRVGADMVLEQMITAVAKSRLKGIIAFPDVNTA